jgi:hypothetical protein
VVDFRGPPKDSSIAEQDFMDAFAREMVPAKRMHLAVDQKSQSPAMPRKNSQ